MSQLIVEIPEDLAIRLRPYVSELPQILELGLRHFDPVGYVEPDSDVFKELNRVIEFLNTSPTPEEIIALRPSKLLQTYINELLEKNRNGDLTEVEEAWWERFEHVEHLVRIAKVKAIMPERIEERGLLISVGLFEGFIS